MSREPLDQSRKLVTELPGPKAREMRESLDTYVPKGVSPSMPAFAARAEGGIVEDVDGNRLIDLGSGIAVTTVGHHTPRLSKQSKNRSPTLPTPALWSPHMIPTPGWPNGWTKLCLSQAKPAVCC